MRSVIAAMLLLAAGTPAVACGGTPSTASTGTAAPASNATSAAASATPTGQMPSPAAPPTSETCAGRMLEAIPGPGVPGGEMEVNADGDRTPDRLYTLPFPEHVGEGLPVSVHVVLDERGGVGVVLPVRNVPIAPIGGYDVNGDGRDELFVKTGEGAYTTWVDVFEFDPIACTLTRLAAPGATLPQFAVGASVGNGAGLTCAGHAFVSRAIGRVSDEPLRYRVRSTTYVISGDALRATGTSERETDAGGAAAAATFDCGDLRLPRFPASP